MGVLSRAVSVAFLASLVACAVSVGPSTSNDASQSQGGTDASAIGPDAAGEGASPSEGGPNNVVKGAPGTLDPSFGAGGTLEIEAYGEIRLPPFRVLPDSSLRTGSLFPKSGGGSSEGIGRLTTAGVIDPAGRAAIIGAGDLVEITDTDADTAFTLIGTRSQFPEVTNVNRFVGGVLDKSYGYEGAAFFESPPEPAAGHWKAGGDIAVHAGKAHVALHFSSNTPGIRAFAVARFTTTGALDSAFGSDGIAVINVADGDLDDVGQLRVDAGGRVYVLTRGQSVRLFRLTPTGTVDDTFGTNGIAPIAFSSAPLGLELDAAGRIYIPGRKDLKAVIARLDENGLLDTSFGAGGFAVANFTASIADGMGMTIVPDGVVLSAWVADEDVGLAHFDTNGGLVTAFGAGGSVRLERAGKEIPFLNAVRYDRAGRIVVVSAPQSGKAMRRIDRVWL